MSAKETPIEIELLKDAAKKLWERSKKTDDYWLTRFVFLRFLGLMYLIGFLVAANQGTALIGENGLLPANNFLSVIDSRLGTIGGFFRLPSVFWFHFSNSMLLAIAWIGVALSAVVLIGFANVPILFILWFLYMSFNHIGQVFWGYGWEIQLLETGFLAMFMVPFLDPRPFSKNPPPVPIIWLLRWLTFRIYLGAGLIKIRGDPCWSDLTCMFYHYETQPIPNPLSPWFHFAPKWFHKIEVLTNHFVELVVPFFIFTTRNLRHIAGIFLVGFQVILIFSGNLSFLNWITITAAISSFDDKFLRRFLPRFITKRAELAASHARLNKRQHKISWAYALIVVWLSVPVVTNLLSSRQVMNTSFNNLHLVNTYGAFGAIGKQRNELVVQGTDDEVISETTVWREYEFKAKPTDIKRKHPIIAPYQPRVDWQIWFAAMQTPNQNPWLVHMIWKFLHNDPGALSLIAENPFQDKPPKHIRVELYQYKFVPPWEKTDVVWERKRAGSWLPSMSKDSPQLREFIKVNNWN